LNTYPKTDIQTHVERIVREVVDSVLASQQGFRIPIGISARHLHITQEDLEKLFGTGYHLTKMKDLPQEGEFAANETVSVIGPNRRIIEKVRILGDIRNMTQIELAYSDGIYLGLKLPHRLSGNIKDSAPFTIVGPEGALYLKEGAIRAMRHIHMNPETALQSGVKNGQKVSVKTFGEMSVTFNNVPPG
jgi:putative phosphotransacetylase